MTFNLLQLLLIFLQHTSLFHVIDARTFETEEIIRIPTMYQSPPPVPPPLRHTPSRSRSSASLQPSPPQRLVHALEDTFRIPNTGSRSRRHPIRSRRLRQAEMDEDFVIIPSFGDRAVENDVQQLLGRHAGSEMDVYESRYLRWR
jgi:hypothetical protein